MFSWNFSDCVKHLCSWEFLSLFSGCDPELCSQFLSALYRRLAETQRRVSHLQAAHCVTGSLSGAGQLHWPHGGKPEHCDEGEENGTHQPEERWEVRPSCSIYCKQFSNFMQCGYLCDLCDRCVFVFIHYIARSFVTPFQIIEFRDLACPVSSSERNS